MTEIVAQNAAAETEIAAVANTDVAMGEVSDAEHEAAVAADFEKIADAEEDCLEDAVPDSDADAEAPNFSCNAAESVAAKLLMTLVLPIGMRKMVHMRLLTWWQMQAGI